MWAWHADALSHATDRDPGDIQIRALARYVVLVPSIARYYDDRAQAIREIFELLGHGWNDLG